MTTSGKNRALDRVISGAIGLLCAFFALALWALVVQIEPQTTWTSPSHQGIFSISALLTSAVMLTLIAYKTLYNTVHDKYEFLSLNEWRIAGLIFIMLTIVSAIYYSWQAMLLPLVLALSCFMKDPLFRGLIKKFVK
jgi:CDP-diglyceride synthetase